MSRRGGSRGRRANVPSFQMEYYTPGPNFRGEPAAGTGEVFPTKFWPQNPDDEPMTIFHGRSINLAGHHVWRYTHIHMNNQLLIMTDGSCANNGTPDARGGCAFIYGPSLDFDQINARESFRLEDEGPFGDMYPQTSNRAELRAVIAALRYRNWAVESFNSIVIATDSDYVTEGVTRWVRRWLQNGWRTRTGDQVENVDLWQCLLGEAERLWDSAIQVLFWKITRNLNQDADELARRATRLPDQHHFVDHVDHSL